LVFSSYLIDIAPFFPTKEVRIKPGTVQFSADRDRRRDARAAYCVDAERKVKRFKISNHMVLPHPCLEAVFPREPGEPDAPHRTPRIARKPAAALR
jgi:hypothetical protein